MAITPGRLVSLAILYIGILISGVLLTRAGRPLSTALFTIHKLVAVAAVVLLAVTIVKLNAVRPLNIYELTIAIAMAVLFIGEIVTGGLLSFDQFAIGSVKFFHRILPILMLCFTAYFFFLVKRNSY